jgi:hypothetical protein
MSGWSKTSINGLTVRVSSPRSKLAAIQARSSGEGVDSASLQLLVARRRSGLERLASHPALEADVKRR